MAVATRSGASGGSPLRHYLAVRLKEILCRPSSSYLLEQPVVVAVVLELVAAEATVGSGFARHLALE